MGRGEDGRSRAIRLRTIRLRPAGRSRIGRHLVADFHERLWDGVNCCILLEMMPAGVTMFMTQRAGEDGTLICAQVWVDQPGAGANVCLLQKRKRKGLVPRGRGWSCETLAHRRRNSEERLARPLHNRPEVTQLEVQECVCGVGVSPHSDVRWWIIGVVFHGNSEVSAELHAAKECRMHCVRWKRPERILRFECAAVPQVKPRCHGCVASLLGSVINLVSRSTCPRSGLCPA